MSWLRQNAYIVAAVTLPVLLALLFIAAREVPHYLVEDPRHDLLIAIEDYSLPNRSFSTQFVVEQDELYARIGYSPQYSNHSEVRLYRYSATAEDWTEVVFEAPAQTLADLRARSQSDYVYDQVSVALPYKVSGRAVAPDGYEFTADWRRDESVVGFFFGMNTNRYINVMHKDGRMINVKAPLSMNIYAGQIKFVAWIVGEKQEETL